MGKDWKVVNRAKLAVLNYCEPLRWEKIGKVMNWAKLAIPSHSEPLRWEKIGKFELEKLRFSFQCIS